MKKKLVVLLMIITCCIFITGCKKETPEELMDGSWDIDITDKQATIEKKALEAFEKAAKKEDKNYRAVALLGKQVVAGTNYMFLAVEEEQTYKMITVYNDLQNEAEFIYNNAFDLSKYTNQDISYDDPGMLVGSWHTDLPEKGEELDVDIQKAYENAVGKIEDADYYPITVVGHQIVAGTNYAVLCYGRIHNEDDNSGVYVLTLYKDLQGAQEIVSSAYVDLTVYAK